MVKFTAYLTLLYGLTVLFLGFIGYQTAGSTMSLVAGSGLGAFVIVSSVFMIKQRRKADFVALFLSLLLMTVFFIRYWATQGVMPLAMGVISACMILFQTIRLLKFVEIEPEDQ